MIDEPVPAAERPFRRRVRIERRDRPVAAEDEIEQRLDLLRLEQRKHRRHRAAAIFQLLEDLLFAQAAPHSAQRRRVADALSIRTVACDANAHVHLFSGRRRYRRRGVVVAEGRDEPRDFIRGDVEPAIARIGRRAGPFRAAVDVEEQRRLCLLDRRKHSRIRALYHRQHDGLRVGRLRQIVQRVALPRERLGQLGRGL